jgi:hypothetical protein
LSHAAAKPFKNCKNLSKILKTPTKNPQNISKTPKNLKNHKKNPKKTSKNLLKTLKSALILISGKRLQIDVSDLPENLHKYASLYCQHYVLLESGHKKSGYF